MMLLRLTWQSMRNRRLTLLLSLLSISISVVLLLGVETVRQQTKSNFSSTVSGTDLVVGARSGQINLLLYSVFHIGDATNNISWKSYQAISEQPQVKWSIPLSLGDSHQGYRVLGTSEAFFAHYRYGQQQPLAFTAGQPFSGLFDVVLGAEVARALEYKIGDEIVIAHGTGNASLVTHDDKPFKVVGILKATGTPVDQTLHVSLAAIEAIHLGWQAGVKLPGMNVSAEAAAAMALEPKQITAFMLGLESRLSTFHLQRRINQYRQEPLLAIIPGLALQQLWSMFSLAEKSLLVVSLLVVVSGFIGLLSLLLNSLNERRREIAILRSVGARPRHIVLLLMLEAMLVTFFSILIGTVVYYLLIVLSAPLVQSELGVFIKPQLLTPEQWLLLGAIQLAGSLIGIIPGLQAYRNSLSDGMSVRT